MQNAIIDNFVRRTIATTADFLHNVANKAEFEENTSPSTAAYKEVREDASTELTYKSPLEASYARSLVNNN